MFDVIKSMSMYCIYLASSSGCRRWNKWSTPANHLKLKFVQMLQWVFERHTNTYLSMWAALNTTSNSELSSSAAFWAITAASPRRDSSNRNWPNRQEERKRSSQDWKQLQHSRPESHRSNSQRSVWIRSTSIQKHSETKKGSGTRRRTWGIVNLSI